MLINQLFAAKPIPFGPKGAPSSIAKHPVESLTVYYDGTDEDEQGNKKLHGGVEKVLHQYSLASYTLFQQHFPDEATKFVPGSIGENISVVGMDDTNVRIGDVYRMGNVVLQVGSPRVPCNKISHRFGIDGLDRFVNQHAISGWYYRVLQTGEIKVGDKVELEATDSSSMTIAEFMKCVNDRNASSEQLTRAANLLDLDPEWRERLSMRARHAKKTA
ncbi:MOSC domain-containing protein [Alteromonas sp. ASW11-36]|uniref:MOSC domain-containing protein n=1 Tax=Alteromonas arenosi TaxID=3055817 RepID=A0ABT7SSA6_9ALTE|nr:MOSC domain-containing protein [Alteromonas sp. ASW11-36]MDM7859075.1 MOSC domain-containing protein [Alteromonas sp. ASW11-36]